MKWQGSDNILLRIHLTQKISDTLQDSYSLFCPRFIFHIKSSHNPAHFEKQNKRRRFMPHTESAYHVVLEISITVSLSPLFFRHAMKDTFTVASRSGVSQEKNKFLSKLETRRRLWLTNMKSLKWRHHIGRILCNPLHHLFLRRRWSSRHRRRGMEVLCRLRRPRGSLIIGVLHWLHSVPELGLAGQLCWLWVFSSFGIIGGRGVLG